MIYFNNNVSFNTQPPEGGWAVFQVGTFGEHGFNTQPPEGGWGYRNRRRRRIPSFNTQPPEGGWSSDLTSTTDDIDVSTHSRLKAAGIPYWSIKSNSIVSTHSRLKAAGSPNTKRLPSATIVSTHSRLKAAGLLGGDLF